MSTKPTFRAVLLQEGGGDQMPKHAPREDFNKLYPFAANTPGAPKRPVKIVIDKHTTMYGRDFIGEIVDDMHTAHNKNGVNFILSMGGVTHPRIVEAAQKTNTMCVGQKVLFPTRSSILEAYGKFKCSIRRDQLPGDIFRHLVRRDGQQDFGLIDPYRQYGNLYRSSQMAHYEMRPYMHDKMVGSLVPKSEKSKKLVGMSVWDGSPNMTGNAPFSTERITRSTDPKRVEACFRFFADVWSKSQSLYNLSGGLVSEYLWLPSPVKYPPVPVCPECKKKAGATPVWTRSLVNPNNVVSRLQCMGCGHRVPFLEVTAERVQ